MIKIIKGVNDKDRFEEEVNKFLIQNKNNSSKLVDIKCIYRDNARQFVYIAIIEYDNNTEYICIPKTKYEILKEKADRYEGLCK